MLGADPNIDIFPETIDDEDDWNFDGANSRDSEQCIGVKRQFKDLQVYCQTKKGKGLTTAVDVV